MQLSSFALPPHPFSFALVPNSLAMKEEEALPAARGRTIALVQQRNAVDRERQQIVVIRQGFAGCVQPIGEQSKAQLSILIREVMNFQPLDLLLDILRGGQQHGDDDDRS